MQFIKKEPTNFELIFLKDGIKYHYQIKYNNQEIKKEKLYYYPNGRIAKILDREESSFEFELSFHPILSKKIVELFMNKETQGQLIFTTHDANLLNLKLLRRDQVYVTERIIKTKFQTNIRSLTEIKGIRKTTDIEKAYLRGEYCSVPVDKDFSEKEIFGESNVKQRWRKESGN